MNKFRRVLEGPAKPFEGAVRVLAPGPGMGGAQLKGKLIKAG